MLTHEMTRGTRTIYLPLKRDADTPPEITIMVRRILGQDGHADYFEAGVAFCHSDDIFTKRAGRGRAYSRLLSEARLTGSANEIDAVIYDTMRAIDKRRGPRGQNLFDVQTYTDLLTALDEKDLHWYFDGRDHNRVAQQAAQEA
jgi:hypothetical protein